jgi:hypothetical protein
MTCFNNNNNINNGSNDNNIMKWRENGNSSNEWNEKMKMIMWKKAIMACRSNGVIMIMTNVMTDNENGENRKLIMK